MDGKMLTNPRLTGLAWLALRLFIAYEWLNAAFEKLTNPAWTGDQVPQAVHKFLTGALAKSTGEQPAVFGWYADFIHNIALPNEGAITFLVAYGELLVGLALLIGLFTKWAAFWGAFMNLNYILAGSTSSNGFMLAAEIAMLFGGAGVAYYGLDRLVMPYLKKLLGLRQEPVVVTPTPRPVTRPAARLSPLSVGMHRRQIRQTR